MNLLREYIRGLLKGAAMGPSDLVANDIYVRISDREVDGIMGAGDYQIFYSDKDGKPTGFKDGVHGEISIGLPEKRRGPCDGAFVVIFSQVKAGWGPLLYDIAMEIATEKGNGLASDRVAVTSDAENVWNYYLNNRSGDVKPHQLDLTDKELKYYDDLGLKYLTKDKPEDDCAQIKTVKSYGDQWHLSSLSKRYTKSSTTLELLRKAKRLIEK